MKEQDHQQTDPGQDPGQVTERPPLFRNWRDMYVFVLLLHALVIAVLYFFTLNYQ